MNKKILKNVKKIKKLFKKKIKIKCKKKKFTFRA